MVPVSSVLLVTFHSGIDRIRRTLGTAARIKAPLLTAEVRRMIEALPENVAGRRDRAQFAARLCRRLSPFRTRRARLRGCAADRRWPRGEAASLENRSGREETSHPLWVIPADLPGSGTGRLENGRRHRGRGVDRHGHVGSVRLHKDSVGLIVKGAAEAAGLHPEKYAGHSLRAGLATQAYPNGAGELAIMRQTGHRSLAMVRRYIRDGSLFRENPAAKLGL
jgi:hypothetical protein